MKRWLGLAARLAVGVVWIYAAMLKLPDPAASIESVRAFELLPASLVEPVGYLLPPLELVLGLALVLGVLTRGAAVLSAVLLAAFIFGISYAWATGLSIDCGCFGDGGFAEDARSQYPWEIARDTLLLGAAIYLVWLRETPFALDSLLLRRPRALDPDTDTDIDPETDDLLDDREGSTA